MNVRDKNILGIVLFGGLVYYLSKYIVEHPSTTAAKPPANPIPPPVPGGNATGYFPPPDFGLNDPTGDWT